MKKVEMNEMIMVDAGYKDGFSWNTEEGFGFKSALLDMYYKGGAFYFRFALTDRFNISYALPSLIGFVLDLLGKKDV